ncbi:MAG: glycosyltransferase family 4 protein [Fimbriimonadaceae bacterium]|nr:glycosyltransferase family 4 protein [Fimbriimonadaceae bacterium]
MSSLRVAVWHNLPFGGAKRALYDHAKGLVDRGHAVEIWQPPLPPDPELDLAPFGPVHVVPLDFALKPGIMGHITHVARLVPALRAHSEACARQIMGSTCDLLFANNCMYFHTPFIGRYVTDRPRALYLQDPFRALYEPMPKLALVYPPRDASLKAKIRDRFDLPQARRRATEELANAKAYDRVLCNSFFSRESILRAFGVSAHVCYLGINADRFLPARTPRERYVFGLGTLGPAKNALLAVEALGRIPADRRPRLVWSANMVDEVYLATVSERARVLGVDFQPIRMLPDADVIQHLNRAGAMIYANRLEPFGLVPLEANACGLPVVAVAEGGVRETVRDGINGLLVDPHPQAIADGVLRMLDEPGLRDRLSESAIAYVRNEWNVTRAADRLEFHLRETLAEAN